MKKLVPLFILTLMCGIFALGGCAPAAPTVSPTAAITPAGEPGVIPGSPTVAPIVSPRATATLSPMITVSPTKTP